MRLVALHEHFDANGIDFLNLTNEFKHCVYINKDRTKGVTIPKLDGEHETIPCEVIAVACIWMEIPIPNATIEQLKGGNK